jgi:UDP-2-acetamido-3-amino-2,3-dideoxy-glucuronate N-acetyltransferase
VREMKELPGGALVHESSYVDEGAVVGKGTRIWHFCHIMSGAEIGESCSLGQNVVVMPRVKLGRNVKVQNNVSIYEGVKCEDDVFLGPSMVFTNVVNPRSHVSRRHEYLPTLVRRGASIGANATVVCGHTLGEYSFVGAGSVVTRDVPAYAMVVGVPARIMGWMCRCGVRLPLDAKPADGVEVRCESCGERYATQGGVVAPLATEGEPRSPASASALR